MQYNLIYSIHFGSDRFSDTDYEHEERLLTTGIAL